jgi:hypothetical protein
LKLSITFIPVRTSRSGHSLSFCDQKQEKRRDSAKIVRQEQKWGHWIERVQISPIYLSLQGFLTTSQVDMIGFNVNKYASSMYRMKMISHLLMTALIINYHCWQTLNKYWNWKPVRGYNCALEEMVNNPFFQINRHAIFVSILQASKDNSLEIKWNYICDITSDQHSE